MKWVNSVDMQVVSNLVGAATTRPGSRWPTSPRWRRPGPTPRPVSGWPSPSTSSRTASTPSSPARLVGPYTEMRTAVRQAVEDMLLKPTRRTSWPGPRRRSPRPSRTTRKNLRRSSWRRPTAGPGPSERRSTIRTRSRGRRLARRRREGCGQAAPGSACARPQARRRAPPGWRPGRAPAGRGRRGHAAVHQAPTSMVCRTRRHRPDRCPGGGRVSRRERPSAPTPGFAVRPGRRPRRRVWSTPVHQGPRRRTKGPVKPAL